MEKNPFWHDSASVEGHAKSAEMQLLDVWGKKSKSDGFCKRAITINGEDMLACVPFAKKMPHKSSLEGVAAVLWKAEEISAKWAEYYARFTSNFETIPKD